MGNAVKKKQSHENEDNIRQFNRSDDNVRLTVRLPRSVAKCIIDMQGSTAASSATEVVKDALILYSALINERRSGNDIFVISPDGERTKYPVFISD